MKKLAVFPYNNDSQTLVKYKDLCRNFIITTVISFDDDKKIMEELNLNEEINYSVDFNNSCEVVDGIIFCENILDYDIKEYRERIKISIFLEKEVYISHKMYTEVGFEFFKNGKVNFLDNNDFQDIYSSKKLINNDIPVISVMGMGENCDKFLIQMKLFRYLNNKGYKVLNICSNYLSILMEMNVLPNFLFDSNLSLSKKIVLFNHYLHYITQDKEIDIIIIGNPGGMMPLNEYCDNSYGEASIVISNAVEIDIGIIPIYYSHSLNNEILAELKQICEIKLNTPFDVICISNHSFTTDTEHNKIIYQNIEENEYIKFYPDISLKDHLCWNILDEKSTSFIIDKILEKLSTNIDVI